MEGQKEDRQGDGGYKRIMKMTSTNRLGQMKDLGFGIFNICTEMYLKNDR